jgi:hypothetical protein
MRSKRRIELARTLGSNSRRWAAIFLVLACVAPSFGPVEALCCVDCGSFIVCGGRVNACGRVCVNTSVLLSPLNSSREETVLTWRETSEIWRLLFPEHEVVALQEQVYQHRSCTPLRDDKHVLTLAGRKAQPVPDSHASLAGARK